MSGAAAAPQRQAGFVLVAVVWFVALLGLVGAVLGAWISRSLDRAVMMKEQVSASAAEIGAVNRILYEMTTSHFSGRGLEVSAGDGRAEMQQQTMEEEAPRAGAGFIALDSRPYRWGDLVLRLQDDRGLLNLNYPDRNLLGNLLRVYGVPYDERGALIDRLADYIDKSPLVRVNGAGERDYVLAGRPPPRKLPLLTPWEPYRVLGWDDYHALWRGAPSLPAVTTVSDGATLNPNTAPEAVLRALPGLDERAVSRLLHYREHHVLTGWPDFDFAAGTLPPDEYLTFFVFVPANKMRLTLMSSGAPVERILALRLTPAGRAPYRIDYEIEQPADAASRQMLDNSTLPPLPIPPEGSDRK